MAAQKKLFKEQDISVALDCYFTTNDFQLVVTVKRLSAKGVHCSGVLLRTDPDEICFQGEFKDIVVTGNKIVVTNAGDSPRFLIDLEKAKAGIFNYSISISNRGQACDSCDSRSMPVRISRIAGLVPI